MKKTSLAVAALFTMLSTMSLSVAYADEGSAQKSSSCSESKCSDCKGCSENCENCKGCNQSSASSCSSCGGSK